MECAGSEGTQSDTEKDSDSESSKSDFGLQADAPKAKRPRKAEARPRPLEARQRAEPKTQAEKPVAGNSEKPEKASKAKAKVAQLTALQTSLLNVSPIQVWQGSVKVKDVEAKVIKAMDLLETVNSLHTEQMEQFAFLAPRLDLLSECLEMFPTLQQCSDIQEALISHCPRIIALLKPQPEDCVRVISTDLGKRVLEAGSFHAFACCQHGSTGGVN